MFSDIREGFGDALLRLAFRCECCVDACDAVMELTFDEYQQVRANREWFVVAPGHGKEERVVAATERFEIVAEEQRQSN